MKRIYFLFLLSFACAPPTRKIEAIKRIEYQVQQINDSIDNYPELLNDEDMRHHYSERLKELKHQLDSVKNN
jgi:hypothetical protein